MDLHIRRPELELGLTQISMDVIGEISWAQRYSHLKVREANRSRRPRKQDPALTEGLWNGSLTDRSAHSSSSGQGTVLAVPRKLANVNSS
jgi:hypothetical protein